MLGFIDSNFKVIRFISTYICSILSIRLIKIDFYEIGLELNTVLWYNFVVFNSIDNNTVKSVRSKISCSVCYKDVDLQRSSSLKRQSSCNFETA